MSKIIFTYNNFYLHRAKAISKVNIFATVSCKRSAKHTNEKALLRIIGAYC